MNVLANVLDQPTLVLNRHWVPIKTAPVREALCLMYKGAARAVEPRTFETFDYRSWSELAAERDRPHVRTVRLSIPVPEVILLLKYGGMPAQEIVFSRRNLFRRDRFTCQYCGARPGPEELTIDHVTPRSRGGVSSWYNCVLACVPCNTRKANRTPAQAGMRLRRRPARPRGSASIAVALGRARESWEHWISRLYWDTELEP
jgi:5-methylcytosine-specific restriction endonuclease McrA